jgi:hypothetical protein
MMADNLLKRAQLLARSARLLSKAAKMVRDQTAMNAALAPVRQKIDARLSGSG